MKTVKINFTILFSLSVLLVLFLFSAFSPVSHSSYQPAALSIGGDTTVQEYYLELKGNVRQSKSINEKEEIKSIDSASITVYVADIVHTQTYTNKKGRCIFKLPLGTNFKIVISKPGFTTKFFEVNTRVPLEKKNTFSFSFDIDLFEEVKGLDISILKKPIAKVTYNLIVDQFAYDINYTSRINFGLKKMYKNYYLFQQNHADSLATSIQQPQTEQKK